MLRHFILLLLLSLSLQACLNNPWKTKEVTFDETDKALFISWQKLDAQFDCCDANIWNESYQPQNEPIMFVRTKNDKFQYAYILNHPQPSKLKNARKITLPALKNLTSLYRIDYMDAELFYQIGNFEFELPIAGHDVFAVTYQKRTAKKIKQALETEEEYQNPGETSFVDVASDDWILFLAHEIFHRQQFKRWAVFENNQNLETYNFSQQNIALILLEQKILKAGIRKGSVQSARRALFEYAIVRKNRELLFGKQIKTLDSAQEIYEGTSRYIEHKLGGLLKSNDFNLYNFADQIESDEEITAEFNGKDNFGFGRFYASGAAIAILLDSAKINWKDSVKHGLNFTDIINENFDLSQYKEQLKQVKYTNNYTMRFQEAAKYTALINKSPI